MDSLRFEEGRDDPKILDRDSSLFKMMLIPSESPIHFDILVEFDFDAVLTEDEDLLEQKRAAMVQKYKEKAGHFDKRQLVDIQADIEKSCAHHTFSVLFPNLDGKRIIKDFAQIVGPFKEQKLTDLVELHRWIRDPFVAFVAENGSVGLLKPFFYWPFKAKSQRVYDGRLYATYIPDILSSLSDYLVRSTPFFFEGGNILVGSNYALIGRDVLLENHAYYFRGLREISQEVMLNTLEQMANSFGVDYVICPDFELTEEALAAVQIPNSFFHLDMFLTLGGRSGNGIEMIVVGELYVIDPTTNDWKIAHPDDEEQRYLSNFCSNLNQMRHPEIRFDIRRVPLFKHQGTLFSYNNALVEICSNGLKRVILPKYAEGQFSEGVLRRSDDRAQSAWTQLGFEVHFLEGKFEEKVRSGKGSLHCYMNVISRNP